jgi:hypothetical protein
MEIGVEIEGCPPLFWIQECVTLEDLVASAAEMLPLGNEGVGKAKGQRKIWFSRQQFLKPEGHDGNLLIPYQTS